MNVELKNVKVAQHLSQETTAFTATVYIDGKRVGTARNSGTGGCTIVVPFSADDRKVIMAAERHFAGQKVVLDAVPDLTVQGSLDVEVDRLVERHQNESDLKKAMRNKTVFILAGALYTSPSSSLAVKARHPGAKILNDLPLTDAVDLFVGALRAHLRAA